MTDGPPAADASATGGRHLDDDTLADLHEGLLDASAEVGARAHLAGCPACAARADRLAALPALLAGAAPVGPVPAEVAAGIDAALSAEAVSAGVAGARTVTPLDPERRRSPWGMRVLQAAAVLVLLLAGAGLALSALGGGSDSSDAGADSTAADAGGSAGRQAEPGQFPLTVSGRSWTVTSLEAAVPDLLAARLAPLVDARTLRGSSSDDAAGGTDDSTATPAPEAAGPSPDGAARLADGPALAECVAALADGPVTPLAVDLATWDGDPAAVILLPTPGDATTVDAWVVAPDCGAADAKVLYFARLARP